MVWVWVWVRTRVRVRVFMLSSGCVPHDSVAALTCLWLPILPAGPTWLYTGPQLSKPQFHHGVQYSQPAVIQA